MSQDRLRVLLVDDERSLREPLTRNLQDYFGYDVDTAADYREAMRLVERRQGQYDVALIDRQLVPPPDGIQLMRDIKARYPEIECIIGSGYGIEERQIALQEGAFRYIEKPFDLDELTALIRAAAQQVRLRAINREVLSKRDLDSVLPQITAAARSLAQADEAEILLLDEVTATLKSYGRSDALSEGDGPDMIEQLTRQVIMTGKTESFADLAKKGDLEKLVDQGFHSLVAIPIPGEHGSLGSLCAYSRKPGHFDKWGDIGLLQTLAGQAGLAIANARAFEETSTLAGYMEALVHATGQLTQTTDLEKQLQLAWDFVREQLKTPTFLVALVDRRDDSIQFPIFYDKNERYVLHPMRQEQGYKQTIIGHVIATGQEFFAPTSDTRKQISADFNIASARMGDECETSLFVPLISGGEVHGAISVQTYEPNAMSHAFQDAFRALANNLASAFSNSRLVISTQRQAKDLETLLGLSRDVASSLELSEVLKRVCQAAVEFFQAEHSSVMLFEEPTHFGEIVVEYPGDFHTVGLRIQLRGAADKGHLLMDREPIVINRVALHETLGPVKDILLDKLDIQSTMIVPVVIKDRLIGTFSIDAVGHERRFTPQEIELARAFAAQVAVTIDQARLFEESESRARLLATLDVASRHIRAEKAPERLMHEIVRLAAELVGCQSGCLLKYDRYRGELVVTAVHQMPSEYMHRRVTHDEGIVGWAARTGERGFYPDYSDSGFSDSIFGGLDFNYGIAIPLRVTGEVAAVLFLADARTEYKLAPAALETLERFAGQAAIALNTSQRLTSEQRTIDQQEVLLKVSEFIQASTDLDKILHVVLTGVTADYGLGFNRAALMLLNDTGERLVGRLGVGHKKKSEGLAGWLADQQQGRDDFGQYIARLESDEVMLTPIGEAIRQLEFAAVGNHVFADVLAERRYQLVREDSLDTLPLDFVNAFQPAFPLIVVPLIARGKTIGLLVADNKFTMSPITEELTRLLLTYVNMAAIAIENRQLFQDSQARLAQVEQTREAARVVAEAVVQQNLHDTLTAIAEHTRAIVAADAVTLYAYDEAAGRFTDWGYSNPEQRNVRSMTLPGMLKEATSPPYKLLELMGKQYYYLVEDGIAEGDLFRGHFVKHEDIKAAIGIQLRARDHKMGTMFVNFRSPHRFTDDELSTLQLFADQAAAAIRNRQLYDEANYRANALQALYEAGRAVSGSLGLQETLDQIAMQALALVGAEAGDGCACHIALKSGSRLRLVAASSPEIMERLKKEMPLINLRPGDKIGIVGRVAVSGLPEILSNAPQDPDYIAFDPRTLSELVVPMKLGDQLIGVINVEGPGEHAFIVEDLHALELLASQAAVAVQNARLYEQTQMVAEIGREASSLELEPFLGSLFGRITKLFSERDLAVFLNLGVYNAEKRALELIPTPYYPAEIQTKVQSIDYTGIMSWVAKHGQPYYAPDVTRDENYNPLLPDTQSEYAVPVFFGNELLGVLDIQSPVLDAFSKEDQALLVTIAQQIASTLHNVRQYEELKRTQGLVGTRTAVAWMGMISGIYRHEIGNSATVIRERLKLLRDDLGSNVTPEVASQLESMERVAQRIQDIPLAPQLSSDEGIQSFPLCELLRQRLELFSSRSNYKEFELTIKCVDAEASMVRVSPEWIKRLIDLLATNAAEAMANSVIKKLTVEVSRKNGRLEVAIQDTGGGIPDRVREHLFSRPVPKRKGEKGSGIGLLMAQLIVETYGGGIDVEHSDSSGTTMRFWLPVDE